MKFGIIKERKSTPDRRVVFSPDELASLKQLHQDVSVKVESSDIRVFTDEQYRNMGIEVANDISDCDVFLGVKEVPIENLIPNKSYLFFSHTLKKQTHNRKLLQALLENMPDLLALTTVLGLLV
jgi:alanine dehydrogenase